uniref:Venom serpin 5 n=1 Tax=Lethocerus distinctifemur TaxID=280095 RepID=A0A2K8JNJ1_9HEMI|nr:venom serpin 5 [Lethocerus distinctifemur]
MSPVNLGLFLFLTLTGGGVRSADDFSNRFTNFDWQLTKYCVQNVGAKSWNDNVVLSPVSLKLVLATLKEGSAGNTSRQLEAALNLSDDPKANTLPIATFAAIVRSLQIPGDGYDLDVGTKVYVDDETEPYDMFKNKIQFLYDAAMEKVDFQKGEEAVKKINKWVESVTKGHIQHLISDSDSLKETSMIILNAIYFKGKWEFPFDPKNTETGEFEVSPSRSVQVYYMKAVSQLSYAQVPSIKASILRLPYSGDKFAMYLVLPEKKNGLEDVIRSITPEKLRQAKQSMESFSVNVRLPKFNFEFTASLMQTLMEMGLRDMFSSRANFSRIAPPSKEDLHVSNVLQKAGLEVNEIGSIAFAATQVELSNKFGEETAEFHVDHPFLFFIEDEPTMTVVFAGKVVDPTLRGSPTVRVIQPRPQPQPQPRPQPAVYRPSNRTQRY